MNQFLVDWCIRFLENRDTIRREIVSVGERKETSFSINYKNTTKQFLIAPKLDAEVLKMIGEEPSGFFILNNVYNISFIITHWQRLSSKKNLMLYFINPFSNQDKAWAINPYVHNMVCDPDSLELGIKAMAEMVEETSQEILEKQLEGQDKQLTNKSARQRHD